MLGDCVKHDFYGNHVKWLFKRMIEHEMVLGPIETMIFKRIMLMIEHEMVLEDDCYGNHVKLLNTRWSSRSI